jgi:hypothetical protein
LVDHASCRGKKINTKGCVISVQDDRPTAALGELTGFRQAFYDCLTARADVFELCDGAPRGAGVPDGGEKTTHLSVVVAAG